MKLVVVTPIGKGHQQVFDQYCVPSVYGRGGAVTIDSGPFQSVVHTGINDVHRTGPSALRNYGMRKHADADWYFFLDADDRLSASALVDVERHLLNADVIFGSIVYDTGRKLRICRQDNFPRPFSFDALVGLPSSYATMSMGFFVRSSIAQQVLFDVSLREGEDMDFYCALATMTSRFVKITHPLAFIGRLHRSCDKDSPPNAGWVETCDRVRARWKKRGGGKLSDAEILARGGVNRSL